jgi:hypothetical protein
MPYGESVDDAGLAGQGMEAREGHRRQGERDDVIEAERTHRWRLYSWPAALDWSRPGTPAPRHSIADIGAHRRQRSDSPVGVHESRPSQPMMT